MMYDSGLRWTLTPVFLEGFDKCSEVRFRSTKVLLLIFGIDVTLSIS